MPCLVEADVRQWNVFLFALVGLLLLAGPASAADGHFRVDGHGRVIITHGLNMVAKTPPYLPSATGFSDDDAAFLHRNGFTSVRLGVIWAAVEPQPGVYDDGYLAGLLSTVRMLQAHGISSLLDAHQDLLNERFQGEGAPAWAVLDGGLPNQPAAGFPGNYFANLALNHAMDSLWTDAAGPGGVGLQERFAAMWAHVAASFRGVPGVLGYEIWNEPWPGTLWATCVPLGCPSIDRGIQALEQKTIDAIRGVDAATPVYYEPNVLFTDGVPTSVAPAGSHLGFSFHDYCLTAETGALTGQLGALAPLLQPVGQLGCALTNTMAWQNEKQHETATGATPLLTEFGATTDITTITDVMSLAEKAMVGWQYWAYCGCGDPTTTGPGAEQALVLDPHAPPVGANVDQNKLAALAVPYPAVTAGTPTSYHFDRTSHVFTASWTTRRYDGGGTFGAGARSRVAVPRVAYPHGYTVAVRGGHIVSKPDKPWLVIAQDAGAGRVTVTVRPR